MTLDNQDLGDSAPGSLESIEKELKSIKLLLSAFMLLALVGWASYMSRQATGSFWLETMYSSVVMVLTGVLITMISSSQSMSPLRKSPRFQKTAAYIGIGATSVGLAFCLIAVVANTITLFV